MIQNVRVDHRLLHGQVALSWTKALGADCILIANDAVVDDQVRKTVMKLAKPAGVKLVIKNMDDSIAAINSGVTEKYKLFVVVESIGDVYRLAKGCKQIKAITLGGTLPRENARKIGGVVFATPEEERQIRELLDDGLDIEIRMVPVDSSISARSALS